MRPAVVFALALSASIAGCVDDGVEPLATSPAADHVPTTIASSPITATDQTEAPVWTVGTWFGHHVFFGADDREGQHYNTIVTSVEGDSYFLASDDDSAARDEAAFDIPILGPVRKADLHVTGLGGQWDLFRFPMREGTTWGSTFSVTLEEFQASWNITHVAIFNPGIETPFGPRPGWDVTATTDEGEVLLAYDYVPDLGWYAHLFVYDLLTPEPDDFVFHVMSMGRGTNWTGQYFVYEGKSLLQLVGGFAPSTDVPPDPFVQPQPLATFTMTEGSTLLHGFIFAVAVGGAHEVVLVDPNGEHHEFQAVGTPEAAEGGDVDLPTVPGEWRLVSIGAAAIWIEVAYLWELTAVHGQL